MISLKILIGCIEVKSTSSGVRAAFVQTPALPPTSYGTCSKLCNHSKFQFPHLRNCNNVTSLKGLL